MKVRVEDAVKALQLAHDEACLLDWRRKINNKLREIKMRRVALAIDTMDGAVSSPNEVAPDGKVGGGREKRGVSPRTKLPRSKVRRKAENDETAKAIDALVTKTARHMTAWKREGDVR